MRKLLHSLFVTTVVLSMLAALPAGAEPKVDVQSFKPSPFMDDLFSVEKGNTEGPHLWNIGFSANYQYRPLTIRDLATGDSVRDIVRHQAVMNLLGSYRFLDWLSVGVDLPVVLFQDGPGFVGSDKPGTFGIGDLRILPKVRIVEAGNGRFSIAFIPGFTAPTGGLVDPFMGRKNFTFIPELAFDLSFERFGIAVDASYLLTENEKVLDLDLNDELRFKGGVWFNAWPKKMDLIVEVATATPAAHPFSNVRESPLEGVVGARVHATKGLDVNFGGGMGFNKGYATPDFRALVGLMWTHVKEPPKDSDQDTVIDSEDRCPDKPGPVELHGCPDTDKDGIPDIDDNCPTVPGLAQFQGCPDTDKDGIPDNKDRCPNDAGPEKYEGCPDRDGDGIIDIEDKCPDVPGPKEYAGCPPPRVEVTKEKIVIREKVFFEFDKAKVKSESFSLLQEVAKVLNENPGIKLVRVEGHTDNKGKRAYNVRLSQKRAEAVRTILIKNGVAPERLTAKGFADTVPIASNDTDEGRSINRRVEFIIVESDIPVN